MPLPVAHSLAGGTVYLALDGGDRFLTWRWLALSLVIANAPDLDFLPGFAVGEPNHYHHGVVHSLGALVIVLIVTALVAAAGWRWPLRLRSRFDGVLGTVLIVGLLWSSHLLLDALTEDFREPFGVPLLWPLSDGYYQIWPWFPYVERLRGAGGQRWSSSPACSRLTICGPSRSR